MQKLIRGAALAAALFGVLSLQAQQEATPSEGSAPPETRPVMVHPVSDHPAPGDAGTGAGTAGNGIFYHNGPVILGVTNVYYIWYGNWSVSPNAVSILQNFASSVGGSPYFAINTTYYNGSSTAVSNSVAFAGSTTDNYSQGTNLSDAQVLAVVNSAITSGRLPKDTNAVYFVLTSPDVKESSGFVTSYCGWHDYGTVAGSNIKYAFVGDSATQNIRACAQQTTNSPNGDPGVDGMVSVVAHELEEAVTDPNLNAWYDTQGNENADKCAWTFGTTYTTANGSLANMNLGGRDYLIQRNWVNASGGYCALALLPAISTISPNSGAPGATVGVSISGTNLTGGTVAVSGTGVTAAVVSQGATQIVAQLTIAAGAAAGARTLTVKTVGGTSNSATFTVTGATAAPTLVSVAPSSGTQGASVNVTLTGTNFVSGASVAVAGGGITASGVTIVNATTITASLAISGTAAAGLHAVTVTTSGGTTSGVNFNVLQAPPTLASVSPASGTQGTSVAITLTGTNFAAPATVNVSGTGITVSGVSVVSATSITATLNISATAAAAPYSVSVTTPGGTSAAATFTVSAPVNGAPTLTAMNPSSGSRGTSVNVTLTGTNFTPGSGVRLSGLGASFSNVIVVSPTQITVTFKLAANAVVGVHNVYVVTAAGNSNILPFTVN